MDQSEYRVHNLHNGCRLHDLQLAADNLPEGAHSIRHPFPALRLLQPVVGKDDIPNPYPARHGRRIVEDEVVYALLRPSLKHSEPEENFPWT